MLERARRKNHTAITFVIPADRPSCHVSVVGDFNDWQPADNPFIARADGTRAVTIALPNEQRYAFRYLAHGDYWFDDENADDHDGRNSIVHT